MKEVNNNIDVAKVSEQIRFIFQESNREVVRKVLEACMTQYPRLGETDYDTLVNNAKAVGQLELLQAVDNYITSLSNYSPLSALRK